MIERGPPIPSQNRYAAIIEAIFHAQYERGERAVDFAREDIVSSASALNISLPKNLGDLIYSFRYRTDLPASILAEAPEGETWIIRSAGRSKYRFVLVSDAPLAPNPNLAVTKIPDSTPGIIAKVESVNSHRQYVLDGPIRPSFPRTRESRNGYLLAQV